LAVKLDGNRGAQQENSVSTGFKRNCTISAGIPNLIHYLTNGILILGRITFFNQTGFRWH